MHNNLLNDRIKSVKTLQLYPKAYFNWLTLKKESNSTLAIEPWQVEDYRELATALIFERLESLGLSLTAESFLMVAENYQSPEELTHYLWPDKQNEFLIYLLIFELWRRLVPDKQSLSIFADELDYRIKFYLKNRDAEEIHLRNGLQRMEEILEKSVDAGESPNGAFIALQRHMAHNLESFLSDYITDQIEEENVLEATDLIDTYYPFVADRTWFDFLKARLLTDVDTHEGNLAFKKLLEEQLSIDLLLEIATFLIHHADPALFIKTSQMAANQIQTEEDFQELLAIIGDYCHFIEKEEEEKKIEAVFSNRMNRDLQSPFNPNDPDAIFLHATLNELQRTEI